MYYILTAVAHPISINANMVQSKRLNFSTLLLQSHFYENIAPVH